MSESIEQPVPSPVAPQPEKRRGLLARYWWAGGLVIAAVVVVLAANFASPDPDGLERVAEDKGFMGAAQGFWQGIMPDYTVPGVNGTISTILAGIIGVAIVLAVALLVGRVLARRRAGQA